MYYTVSDRLLTECFPESCGARDMIFIKGTFCFFFFFIRTSNFGAEPECSYIFLRFVDENAKLLGIHYMYFGDQCGRDQETHQSALPAEIWYQELLIMTNRDVCHHC